jgi:ribosome maturation factor RimP
VLSTQLQVQRSKHGVLLVFSASGRKSDHPLWGWSLTSRKRKGHNEVPRPPSPPESRNPQSATPSVEAHVLGVARPLAESLCDDLGLELVHLEYLRDRGGRIMRLYIDKPGGVSLEDCAQVSRELSDVLDVRLSELGAYHLEVSSPGPNRPLSRPGDFERFQGRRAKVRTRIPIDGRKNFSGTLAGLADGALRLNLGRATITIALDAISKAHLTDV